MNIRINYDCVLDLGELTQVSIIKSLVEGEILLTDR